MSSIDVNRLIAAIHKRSSIWDKSNTWYADRNAVDHCWKEIAQEMNADEARVRKKWKYLRDNFCVEYGKWAMQRQEGDDDHPLSKWQYFQQLMFLKDIVTPRAPSNPYKCYMSVTPVTDQSEEDVSNSNLNSEPHQESDHEDAAQFPDLQADLFEGAGTQDWQLVESQDNGLTLPVQRTSKRKRNHKNFFNKRLADVQDNSFLYSHNYNYNNHPGKNPDYENTDLMFFKTLLPHVNLIPLHKKLEFQSQVQAVVQKFAHPESGNAGTPPAPSASGDNPRCSRGTIPSSSVSQSDSQVMTKHEISAQEEAELSYE